MALTWVVGLSLAFLAILAFVAFVQIKMGYAPAQKQIGMVGTAGLLAGSMLVILIAGRKRRNPTEG